MKNIDVFTSDVLLKINASSIKYFLAIDFLDDIDHKNGKNKIQLLDERLEVLIAKKVPGKWLTLEVQNQTKPELMKRRNESIDRYYELEKKLEEKSKDNKYQMEKQSIEEMMAIEKHQRKTIKHQKKDYLQAAKDDLFKDLEDVNEMDKKLIVGKNEYEKSVKMRDFGEANI
jgi:hypothetical protein